MPGGEFRDPFDGDFDTTSLFHISDSPNALQSLDTIGANDHKSFLSPQELSTTSGPFPDSPSDSYQDSSSDSAASWKRNGSSTSSKTPATTGGDAMMEYRADEAKMQWGGTNFGGFDDGDSNFIFGQPARPSSHLRTSFEFSPQDDSFMDQSFDFDGASDSPKPATTAAQGNDMTITNPSATLTTGGRKATAQKKTAYRGKARANYHSKEPSVRVTCVLLLGIYAADTNIRSNTLSAL